MPIIAANDFICDNPWVCHICSSVEFLEPISVPYGMISAISSDGRLHVNLAVWKKTLLPFESPVTGVIEASPEDMEVTTSMYPKIVPFELRDRHGDLLEEKTLEALIKSENPRPRETTLDFFTENFGRWRAATLADNLGEIDHEVELYDSMIEVVHEIDELSLFKPDIYCLCHVDLHQGNIMVEVQSDASLELTAILDWDEAVFAPNFVACEPRWRLWDDDEWHVDEEGLLTWPYELEGANNLPSTPEKQELKRYLQSTLGQSTRV